MPQASGQLESKKLGAPGRRDTAALQPTSERPVVFTEAAVRKAFSFAKHNDEAKGKQLRVSVRSGGCSEFEYAFTFDTPKEGDMRIPQCAAELTIEVLVDQFSIPYLDGCIVDYWEELSGNGFKVTNPNAAAVHVLRIPALLKRRLNRWARDGYPSEVCGLLVGRGGAGAILIERVEKTGNLAAERLQDRFLLDPDDHLAVDETARRDGLDIVGVWHTHPDHPARPSGTDLEAAWEGYVYLILSVGPEGVVDCRAWRLDGSRFIEQRIEETTTWRQ